MLVTVTLNRVYVLNATPHALPLKPALRCSECGGLLDRIAFLPPPPAFDTS
jgi:hypothetical protein